MTISCDFLFLCGCFYGGLFLNFSLQVPLGILLTLILLVVTFGRGSRKGVVMVF